jgi:hypothetical protein
MDVASPPSVRRESDPIVGVSTSASNEALRPFDNEQPNWMPIADHSSTERGQDVQRTLQGLAIGTNSLPRSTYGAGDINSTGYVNSENNNSADTGLSPDTAHSGSNRPTPNSTTPSEPRSNLQTGGNSGGTSYETSPDSSHQTRLPTSDGRSMSSFFATHTSYSELPATGLTPENPFTMPETPGREFPVPNGWEMSQQTTGLTPVGEGVFRQLMGLGPIDPMDLGWEGGS